MSPRAEGAARCFPGSWVLCVFGSSPTAEMVFQKLGSPAPAPFASCTRIVVPGQPRKSPGEAPRDLPSG